MKYVRTKLKEGLPETHYEIYNILLALVIKHGLTYNAALDFLKTINFLTKADSPIPESRYLFLKLCTADEYSFTRIFICLNCNVIISRSNSSDKVECSICQEKSQEYFISFYIGRKLEAIIEKNFIAIEKYKIELGKNECITDIQKGDILKSLFGPFFSITFNTDGVNVFNTSQKSLWPILVILNDLPPHLRFLKKNCVVAGLWLSNHKPIMKLFLQPFIDELNILFIDGINIQGKTFKIICIAQCSDSDARYVILNMQRFNASYGCTVCYQKGIQTKVSIRKRKDQNNPSNVEIVEFKQIRFHFQRNLILREKNLTAQYAERALQNKAPVKGIKGRSILFDIPLFDPCRQSPIDVMHACFLGLVKRILDCWLKNSDRSDNFFDGPKSNILKKLDERMINIKTITECPREPKKLSDYNSFVANEFYFLLMHYSIIFIDLIEDDIMENFHIFRKSIAKLMSNSLKENDVKKIDKDLTNFVKNFELLYGKKNMVFNVHIIRHLSDTVLNFGPLWTTSLFSFESMNGVLRSFNPVGRKPLVQIAKRCQLFFNAHYGRFADYISEEIIDFCDDLFESKGAKEKKPKNVICIENEEMEFETFNQFRINYIIFSTFSYSEFKQRNDSFIQHNNEYFQIEKIYRKRDSKEVLFYLRKLAVINILYENFNEYEETNDKEYLNITNIEKKIIKCIQITIEENNVTRKFLSPVEFYLYND